MPLNLPRLLTASLIPLLALAVTIMLGVTPWGEVYRTLMARGVEEKVAAVSVAGMGKIAAGFEIAMREGGAYVIVNIREGTGGTEARLTVPADWKLQEVRGVHIREIAGVAEGNRQAWLFPGAGETRFVFTTSDSFDALAFSHDSPVPALVSLTTVALPGGDAQKSVQLVESGWVFPML